MPNPIGAAMSAPTGFFGQLTASQPQVGSIFNTTNGTQLVWCLMGGVAGVPGSLYQAAAEITDHQNLTPTANVAIGALSFTVTLGATAATANQYAGGMAIITTSTGAGYQYEIASHPAAALSATLTLTLNPTEPVQVAFVAATSKVDLVANPYSGVIINPVTATSAPVGVCVSPIAIGSYGWLVKKGPAAVLADGTVTVGTAVVASNATAGAVEALTGVQAIVGNALTGIATTQYGAILVNL